jgi:hypothetical protein
MTETSLLLSDADKFDPEKEERDNRYQQELGAQQLAQDLLHAVRTLGGEEEELLFSRKGNPQAEMFGAGYLAALRAIRGWLLARDIGEE